MPTPAACLYSKPNGRTASASAQTVSIDREIHITRQARQKRVPFRYMDKSRHSPDHPVLHTRLAQRRGEAIQDIE